MKKSRVIPIMLIISLVLIVTGIIGAISFYNGVSGEISKDSEILLLWGIDVASIADKAGIAGAFVLSVFIVIRSFVFVALQWLIFVLVKIIKNLIKKSKNGGKSQ